MPKDGEIVGLNATNNGRTCEAHACCGEHLQPGELICFKFTVVDVDGFTEEAVKAVCERDGTEMCTVGFRPRHIVTSRKDDFVGHFAQIIELYGVSDNEYMRKKSYRNLGIASFHMLDDIQDLE